MAPTSPKPRDKVWIVPNDGREKHPAVVVRVSDDGTRVLVVSGTGTGPRDMRHVAIAGGTRLAKRFGLIKTTYFYVEAIHVRDIANLDHEPKHTFPMDHWADLQDLALDGSRQRLSAVDFAEWWPDDPATPKDE